MTNSSASRLFAAAAAMLSLAISETRSDCLCQRRVQTSPKQQDFAMILRLIDERQHRWSLIADGGAALTLRAQKGTFHLSVVHMFACSFLRTKVSTSAPTFVIETA